MWIYFLDRAGVRAGATGAIAPVDFEKGLFAPVDFEELLILGTPIIWHCRVWTSRCKFAPVHWILPIAAALRKCLTLIRSTFRKHPVVGGGPRWPIGRYWPISQPFMVRFSKFLCLVKACENRHWFLFHKRLPIVHRLVARGRRSDDGQSRQFFQPRKSKIFNF